MSQGVILVKNQKFLIPDDLLAKTVELNKTAAGCALVMPGNKYIDIDAGIGAIPLSDAKKAQEAFKEATVLFWYVNAPSGAFLKEDLQPFVLIRDSNEKPILVAFLEGDFSAYKELDSSHTNEFFAIQKHILPKFTKLYGFVGNNIDKLMAELDDPVIRGELIQNAGTRGTITFLAGTGQISTFHNNDLKRDYVWGWTSNAFGMESPADVKNEAAPSVMSNIANLKAKLLAGKVSADKPVVAEEKKEEKLVTPPPAANDVVMWRPGPELRSNNQVRQAYLEKCGFLPPNWKQRPEVAIKHKGKTVLKDMKELGIAIPPETLKKSAELGAKLEKEFQKNTTPKHIPTSPLVEDIKEQAVTEAALPCIPPVELKEIHDSFFQRSDVKRLLDKNGQELPFDPATFQELETKHPTYTEQVGMTALTDTSNWSDKAMYEHCHRYPHATFALLKQFRIAYFNQVKKNAAAPKPVSQGESEEKTPSIAELKARMKKAM